jgi:hypothetical protein
MPTFNTPEPISATLDVALGDVRINATDSGTTVVEVQPSDASNADDRKAAELTRVDYANGQLQVKAPKLGHWRPGRDGGSIELTIEVPTGSHVHGGLGQADFQADGRLGDCRVKTGLGRIALGEAGALILKSGTGDISVDHATGHAEVTTGSGDVRLRELDSSAVIKNSNGATWIGVADGDLRVNAANGGIAVDAANAGVVAKSANGDVRVGEVARGSVVLESKLGDVEVGVREGTAAWLDVNATAGRVRNALEEAGAPESSAETVEVRARTTVGEIVIRRS